MSLIISQADEKEFEIVPEGIYSARCYQVIDLGTQKISWMGNEKLQRKGMIYWEILDPETKMQDGRPFSISRKYTLSMYDQGNLYQDLVAWRGKSFTQDELQEFNIGNVLGAPATIQVIHELSKDGKKTYANMKTILQYKGVKLEPVNPNKLLELTPDTFDRNVFESLSQYLKDQITESPEYQNIIGHGKEEKDVVIEDINENERVNLDEIPF
jgi:hypothetical protein